MAGKARTASIAELARDGDGWSPLRMHLDVRAFGVNAWTASEAGAQLVGEHDEVTSGHEELYLITTGSATFTVDGEEITAAGGHGRLRPRPDDEARGGRRRGRDDRLRGRRPARRGLPAARVGTERVGLPALRRGRLQRRQASADRGARPVRGSRGAALQHRLRRGEAGRDRGGDRAPRREHRAASVLRRAGAQRRGSRRDQGRSAFRRDRRRGTDGGLDPADRGAAAARDAHGPLGGCVELPEHPGDLEQLLCLSASLEHGLACVHRQNANFLLSGFAQARDGRLRPRGTLGPWQYSNGIRTSSTS